MQGFFMIKQGIQSIFGILFVSQLLFGLFVLRFLRGYLLTCYNLIGQWCVILMGWSNQSVRLFFLCIFLYLITCSLVFLWWEDSSSFSCTSFLSIYSFVISYKKKNMQTKDEIVQSNKMVLCVHTYKDFGILSKKIKNDFLK